jgi:ADP-ribosylglycohydrolase
MIAEESGGRQPGVALAELFPPAGGVDALVPFIFGIVYATQSARRAIVEALNQGGPAPVSAGIAGAICAAAVPGTLPRAWVAEVEQVNTLDLAGVARGYLDSRSSDDATG